MKYKVYVEEVRRYTHTLIVDVESEKELNEILDEIEIKNPLGICEYEDELDRRCDLLDVNIDDDGDLDSIECIDISISYMEGK